MTPASLITALRKHSRQAEEQLHQAERALGDATELEVRLEHQITARLTEIASLKLDNNAPLDPDIFRQMQQREQAQAMLRNERDSLEGKIAEALEQQQGLHQQLDALEDQVRARLEQDIAFSALCEQLERAHQAQQDAQPLYEEIRDECASKLPGYDANPIYRFLKMRQYGSEQYRPYRLQRGIDDFLARKVGFAGNQANERILLAMQTHNDTQQQARAAALASLEEQQQQQLAQARQAAGMQPLQAEAQKLAHVLQQSKAQANALHGQLDIYTQRQDPMLRHIRASLTERLRARPLAELVKDAARTPDSRDDTLVAELQILYPQLLAAEKSLEQLQDIFEQGRWAYDRAKQAERTLGSEYYQAHGCQYLLKRPIEQILTTYMQGDMSLQQLETLLQTHRTAPEPRTPQRSSSESSISWSWDSGSTSSGSSSPTSSGGGFSSSGSSGGGGFRTTDSF